MDPQFSEYSAQPPGVFYTLTMRGSSSRPVPVNYGLYCSRLLQDPIVKTNRLITGKSVVDKALRLLCLIKTILILCTYIFSKLLVICIGIFNINGHQINGREKQNTLYTIAFKMNTKKNVTFCLLV